MDVEGSATVTSAIIKMSERGKNNNNVYNHNHEQNIKIYLTSGSHKNNKHNVNNNQTCNINQPSQSSVNNINNRSCEIEMYSDRIQWQRREEKLGSRNGIAKPPQGRHWGRPNVNDKMVDEDSSASCHRSLTTYCWI
jgi:hypothetical protein